MATNPERVQALKDALERGRNNPLGSSADPVEQDIRRRQLEDQVPPGSECARCHGRVWVGLRNGAWEVRCLACYPEKPAVVKKPSSKILTARRFGNMMNDDMSPEERALVQRSTAIAPFASTAVLTIEEYDSRRTLIAHVCSSMVENVDYGKIPGTDSKNLWEPGAEHLREAIGLIWTPQLIREEEVYGDDPIKWNFRYVYRAVQLLGPGIEGVAWEAEAWSRERKFWCAGPKKSNPCPSDCLGNHGPKGMEAQMLAHNVRDRGIKRAFVALVRNITGTTAEFRADRSAPEASDEQGRRTHAVPRREEPAQTSVEGAGEVCPVAEHKGAQWEDSRYGLQHRIDGGGFCKPTHAYEPILQDLEAGLGIDRAATNGVLNTRYDATWSKLTLPQIKETLATMRAKLGVPETPTEAATVEVQTQDGQTIQVAPATGEVVESTAPAGQAPF